MRQAELEAWVEALRAPIGELVREARLRLALLVNGSGRILAQHGFALGFEVANVAALAAAAHASARALAELTGARRWTHLHHAGTSRQLFLAPFETPADELILVGIFEDDSSLGLVQLYFDRFAQEVSGLPVFRVPVTPTSAESFERELEAGLRRVLPPEWL